MLPSCQKDEIGQDYLMKSTDKPIKPKIKQEVSDIDGNVYTTVKIGKQMWLMQNLRTTKYNDGTEIQKIEDNVVWSTLTSPAYCWHNNDEASYKETYGALYNWYAVNTGKICPTGWHVPSMDEFTTLINYLIDNGYGFEGSGDDIASSLASTSGWYIPLYAPPPGSPCADQANNNSSGFSAFPAGRRSGTYEGVGLFQNATADAFFWTSSEYVDVYSDILSQFLWIRGTYPFAITTAAWQKEVGLSVRCLQD